MSANLGFPYFAVVTPNDGADLSSPCQAISVAVAGNVVCRDGRNVDVTIPVPANVIWPVNTRRILATGTTATGIVAYW